MNQHQQIPHFEFYTCPLGHDDLCPRKRSTHYVKNEIICLCYCHKIREKGFEIKMKKEKNYLYPNNTYTHSKLINSSIFTHYDEKFKVIQRSIALLRHLTKLFKLVRSSKMTKG